MTAAELTARLDRLPLTRMHRVAIVGLAFAFFFELADLNTFSYAAPALREHLGLSVDDIAIVTAAGFLGMFLGATIGGRLADLLGRKRSLIVSVLWFSVFSLSNAAASGVPTLLAARLLTGVGLGAMTSIAITYLSELMPAHRRGRMQGLVLALGLIGIPVMAFFSRAVVPISANSWRWVFIFGALGFLGMALLVRLPESPQWLLAHRGPAEAETVVHQMEEQAVSSHGPLPVLPAEVPLPEDSGKLSELFKPPLLRRTVVLLVAWVFQTLGFYGFVAWVPTLLADHGFSLENSLTFSALTTIGAVPGALAAWLVSDRFGRRGSSAIVAVIIAICGMAYGLSFNIVAIVLFGFLVSFFIQTFAALLYAYTPEQYPTSNRNSGSGLAYGVGRLANIVGPLIVAALYDGLGYAWVFAYIAACWLVVAIAVGIFGTSKSATGVPRAQQPSAAGADREPRIAGGDVG